ncbi:unnamed protein product [Polarella glacialis]|uniref:Histone RNA hairpin-binding protein RNA-binding domain-containing protein n=1 Tax=Polarella glacialis TaxID=89957 RepID=A0A813HCT9_POLGL|nr:unnamed protein product [Polarella glacialis]
MSLRNPAAERQAAHSMMNEAFADDAEEEAEDSEATWSRREAARMRQIMIGKARPEYRRYIAEVPAEIRDPAQPGTPNPKDRVSKRQFDRSLGDWRRRLHEFDAEMGWAPETLEADAAGGLLGCGEALLREPQGSPQRGLQLSAPEFTPQLGPCPPPRMLLTPGGASLSTQGCPSVTPVSKSRRHRGGRGGNGSGEPGMLPPPPAFPPAPVHPAPMEFSFRDEPAAPSSGTGIVQLRLADQLPEPLPLPPGVVSAVSAAAAAAAAADYAAAASAMQWSMPWETDCEALLAASGMSPEMAALLTLQPDPETPLRPHRLNYYSEDATPPPIDYQFDARYGHHHTLGMVCEEPWQKGTRLTYEDAICASADPSSSVRWPSPPRMSVSVPGSPAPKTPPRHGPNRSPPSSVVKTPTRGLWAAETPSPQRFYPHSHLMPQPHLGLGLGLPAGMAPPMGLGAYGW